MSASRVIETAALAFSLIAFRELLAAAIAIAFSRALALIVIYYRARHELPWFSLRPRQFDRVIARELFTPSITYAGFPFGMAAVNQGMVLVVGSSLGSVALVAFTTTRTMCNVVLQLSNVVTQGSLPELTRSLAEGDATSARRIFRFSAILGSLVCGSTALLIAILGPSIVELWTGGSVVVPGLFVALMAVTTVADFPWQVHTNVLRAQNLHQRVGIVYMACCGIALVAALLLIKSFGLNAVPVALFIIDLFVTPLSIIQVRRTFGLAARR